MVEISVEILSTSVPITTGIVRYKVKTWWAHVDVEEDKTIVKLPSLPMIEHYYKLNGKSTTIFVELWYANEELYPVGAMRFLGLTKCPIDEQLINPILNPSVEWLEVYDPIEDIIRGRLLLKIDARFSDSENPKNSYPNPVAIPDSKSDIGDSVSKQGSPRKSSSYFCPCHHAKTRSECSKSSCSPNPSARSAKDVRSVPVQTQTDIGIQVNPRTIVPHNLGQQVSDNGNDANATVTVQNQNLHPPRDHDHERQIADKDKDKRQIQFAKSPPAPEQEKETVTIQRRLSRPHPQNDYDLNERNNRLETVRFNLEQGVYPTSTSKHLNEYPNREHKHNDNREEAANPANCPNRVFSYRPESQQKQKTPPPKDKEDEIEDVIHLLNDNFDLVNAHAHAHARRVGTDNTNAKPDLDVQQHSTLSQEQDQDKHNLGFIEPKSAADGINYLGQRQVNMKRNPQHHNNRTTSYGHNNNNIDSDSGMTVCGVRWGIQLKPKTKHAATIQSSNYKILTKTKTVVESNSASFKRPPRSRKIAAAIFNDSDND